MNTIKSESKKFNQFMKCFVNGYAPFDIDYDKLFNGLEQHVNEFNHIDINYVLFKLATMDLPENTSKHDMSKYPKEVQDCLKRSNNFLLYNSQMEELFYYATGSFTNAKLFRRTWNKKIIDLIKGYQDLKIGNMYLLDIINELLYDQKNRLACSEMFDIARDIVYYYNEYENSTSSDKVFNGASIINYYGDEGNDKDVSIPPTMRTNIDLTFANSETFWVDCHIKYGEEIIDIRYNLLGKEMIQNDIYFMNPRFYRIYNKSKFYFTSMIVWLHEGSNQHFSFGVNYTGELPEEISADIIL
jgi:hypothetical protein